MIPNIPDISSSGQSTVIQFILFILVGLAIFTSIGNLFRFQSDILRDEISNYSVEMVNSYLSSVVVASVDTCKKCDVVENKIKISDSFFSYYLEASLGDDGLTVSTHPEKYEYSSSINNLNESIDVLEGAAPSIQTINLTYDRTQNKLEIR